MKTRIKKILNAPITFKNVLLVFVAAMCIAAGSTPISNGKLSTMFDAANQIIRDIFNQTPNEIWISSTRSDGHGKGTQIDPFDGHTRADFDARMVAYASNPNLHVHLSDGTFSTQVSPTNAWFSQPGWTIEGNGREATVLQADPATNLAGVSYTVVVINAKNNTRDPQDGLTVKNLTVECNWPTIGSTADNGYASAGSRSDIFTDGKTISGSPNITSSTAISGFTISTSINQGVGFQQSDVFRFLAGSGIPMTSLTTIASGSNGVAMSGTYTVNVVSTTGAPAYGQIIVASGAGSYNVVTYASKNSTQFLTCTGGTGNMATGGAVSLPTTTITKIPQTTVASTSDGVILFAPLTSVTTTVSTSLLTKTTHGFVNGQKVVPTGLSSTTGLTNGTTYFVVSSTANTFQLSATSGGSAITMGGSNDSSVTVSCPALTVVSTTDFYGDSTHGGIGYVIDSNSNPNSFTYTGKTSTTFTGFVPGGTGTLRTGGKVSSNNQAVMSANATATATGVSVTIGGDKLGTICAIGVAGSRITLENLRARHNFGDQFNNSENFAISISASTGSNTDATSDLIKDCVVDSPSGNYGSPFALFGSAVDGNHDYGIKGRITGCSAYGHNTGVATGFTSGGVNLAHIIDSEIDHNHFFDCQGIAYHDTDALDGLKIHDNTAIRCWAGVSNTSASSPENRLEVYNNTIDVQNRLIQGANYGIVLGSTATTNSKFHDNIIRSNTNGFGYYEHRGWWESTSLPSSNWVYMNIIDSDGGSNLAGTTAHYFKNLSSAGADNVMPDRNDRPSYTVATLPTPPSFGMSALVTDGASSIAVGATVTGSGSTKYEVWYNGTAWTVSKK